MLPDLHVWIFTGNNGSGFPSGAFDSLEIAEDWISEHKLSGTLTAYPLNTGVYDWVVTNELVGDSVTSKYSPDYVSKFSSAMQDHIHYENGNAIG
ncbi:MAG: hypothetical protein AAF542_25575 [Pseudomonadota bacterium]